MLVFHPRIEFFEDPDMRFGETEEDAYERQYHELRVKRARQLLAAKFSPLGQAGDHYLACKAMVSTLDSILQMN